MMHIDNEHRPYYEAYYSDLVGAEIIAFEWQENPGDSIGPFPAFFVRKPNGEVFQIVISEDEEGNGPGYIFGLIEPKQQQQGA